MSRGMLTYNNEPYTEFINVKLYGALGDGVTDDAAAINRAITASESGSMIYFPPGVYLIGSRILMKSGRTYMGGNWNNSAGSKIKLKDSTAVTAMLMSQSYEDNSAGAGQPVNIRDLIIDGNKDGGATGKGIWLFNYRSKITDVYISETSSDGIHVEGGTAFQSGSLTCIETWITRCLMFAVAGRGIAVIDTDGNKITDGFITDCVIGGNLGDGCDEHGIYVESGSGWKITGNHLYQIGKSGIYVLGANFCDVSHNYIESYGRLLATDTYYGIRVAGLLSSSGSTPAVVIGNRVYNSISGAGNVFYGVYARTANAQTNCHVVMNGNHVRGNGSQFGYAITNGTGGAICKGAVQGNSADNCGTDITFGDGAQVRVDGNTFNYQTSQPSTGEYWPRGTRVNKSDAAASGYEGWIVTAQAASPTWKQFGTISA